MKTARPMPVRLLGNAALEWTSIRVRSEPTVLSYAPLQLAHLVPELRSFANSKAHLTQSKVAPYEHFVRIA